jgi:hypothetical protein
LVVPDEKERRGFGMWEKTDKNGGKYWMGKFEGKVFFLRKNKSDNPNAPVLQVTVEDERKSAEKPADDGDF